MGHALLAPSSSSRWMICTPSARLESSVNRETTSYAEEGTFAHIVVETILKNPKKKITRAQIVEFKQNKFWSKSLLNYCEAFVDYILDFYEDGDILFSEKKLDLSKSIPECSGTIDVFIIKIRKKLLITFDLKYGKGVLVSAIENKQQMIYALGVLDDWGLSYDIENVWLHIYQPRINNNSDWPITVKELRTWEEEHLRPKALLAFAGEGEFVTGDHCFFCKVKATCRAMAEHNLELARHDFSDPVFLTDEEIIEIFEQRKLFETWLKSIGVYVIKEALAGKVWPGRRLVEGRSNRKHRDVKKLAQDLLDMGFTTRDIYKPLEIVNLEELEINLGKHVFIDHVIPQLIKPPGHPTLALESDTRKSYVKDGTVFDDGFEYNEEEIEEEF